MKKIAVLFAALAGLFLSAQAQAQAPGKGFYMGLGYGTVWSKGGSFYTGTVNEDTTAGGKLYAGYMSTDNWGLELGLHNLGKYEVFLAGAKTDEFQTTALSVSGVYTQPLFDWGYNVNLRLGLAFTNSEYDCLQLCIFNDTKKRGTSGMIGLGVGAPLTQNLSMRVDFDHFGNVKHGVGNNEYNESYDVFSVNLQLRF